jgi:hypothetical protein
MDAAAEAQKARSLWGPSFPPLMVHSDSNRSESSRLSATLSDDNSPHTTLNLSTLPGLGSPLASPPMSPKSLMSARAEAEAGSGAGAGTEARSLGASAGAGGGGGGGRSSLTLPLVSGGLTAATGVRVSALSPRGQAQAQADTDAERANMAMAAADGSRKGSSIFRSLSGSLAGSVSGSVSGSGSGSGKNPSTGRWSTQFEKAMAIPEGATVTPSPLLSATARNMSASDPPIMSSTYKRMSSTIGGTLKHLSSLTVLPDIPAGPEVKPLKVVDDATITIDDLLNNESARSSFIAFSRERFACVEKVGGTTCIASFMM